MNSIIDDAKSWFAAASVRQTKMGHWIEEADLDWRFPIEMNPLLSHPAISRLEEERYRFLCAQLYHKYMHDICITETDVINKVALDIAYGRAAISFPDAIRTAAFSVVMDEAFHSYAARLFSFRIQYVTGVAPMFLPQTNALVEAMQFRGLEQVPPGLVSLLSCCISESTFTQEILVASRLEKYSQQFRMLMVDHLRDEGRHCSFFRKVLEFYWQAANDEMRNHVAEVLPHILEAYFDRSIEIEFEKVVLCEIGFSPSQADTILKEANRLQSNTSRVRNALEFLHSVRVCEHEKTGAQMARFMKERGVEIELH
ncbi:diiron oxygenase [uncultured Herbaspirillum sp.]|uniref:diiron oxygenase n=1 Tax=uncultured Herbaspirillum sp. TaxID=160236 RepID=UPI00258B1E92|nr:diiron oxygenase [uncultured Herbaspirillum sp.]